MANTDNVYATVLSYQAIAVDEEKHHFIMKDKTMIQFLAYCLDYSETQVVEAALNSFEKLIENKNNHKKLRSIYGVIEALKCTSERLELSSNLTEKADNLVKCLQSEAPVFSTRSRFNVNINKESIEKTKFETKLSTFHIHGLSMNTRLDLEKTIVNIKGVVSVLVDVEHQRCVVRLLPSITPEEIAKTVTDSTSMEVKLVVRNANNQEKEGFSANRHSVSLQRTHEVRTSPRLASPALDKEKLYKVLQDILKDEEEEAASLPPYLPEENSPIKEKAVVSLSDLRNNATSWISAATSFFRSSFYW